MANLWRSRPRPEPFRVLSLNEQARIAQPLRVQSQFEVMVRHLFDRMLNNESFGEDAALRVTQLAYAIALPGLLVALFLFPAYHGLPPLPQERSYWSQACDHLFYVTYSFVILGTAMVFQWEMLFPDLLDVYILSSLPVSRARLLLGRVAAMGVFLGLVQAGTSGLGNVFLPAVADLHCGFGRHFAAHAAAVTMSGVFAAAFFVALQGMMVSLLGRRTSGRVSSGVKALSVVVLLTVLFLFPLTAHSLADLLSRPGGLVHWFPPFWFLGVYESVLWGRAAQPVFHELARTGLLVTAGMGVIGALLYPLAYARRVQQIVEGAGTSVQHAGGTAGRLLQSVFDAGLLRTAPRRAVFHFVAQTLLRLPRLHLYMSMYAGLGLALVISGLVAFRLDGVRVRAVIVAEGVRMAVPVLAFWTVAGLRTALLSPLGRQGSWIFRVVGGRPQEEELRGAKVLVATVATLVTLSAVAILHFLGPPEVRGVSTSIGQVMVGVGLCVVLTDLFFLTVRSIPFTRMPVKSTQELPWILVRYLVVFPGFALSVVGMEGWIEASGLHLLATVMGLAVAHVVLTGVRRLILRGKEPMEELLFLGLGLRDD
jgi:hypothetical protein